MDDINYLYYCRTDGLGFQYAFLSRLLPVANKLHAKVLVDWRCLSFFLCRQQAFSTKRLHKFVRIQHPRLIYDPIEIDQIMHQFKKEIAGVRPGKIIGEPLGMAQDLTYYSIDDLYPNHEDEMDCLSQYIKLEQAYMEQFAEFKPIVSQCVGVHARLGNGEEIWNPAMRDRMNISPARFFNEMDKLKNRNFFVCTDTQSFMDQCIERYGERIVYITRNIPPENSGPGHRLGIVKTNQQFDGYELLVEALLELLLLGECKRLICNKSLFTFHARRCEKVDSIVLANDASDYSL